MKPLDLDFTRTTARSGAADSRAGPADRAFEGALRDATERAEAPAAPPREEGAREPYARADARGDEPAAEETAADPAAADGGAGDDEDARAADDGAAGDSASSPLAVAPATSPHGAQAQAVPPSCAAAAQRRPRPGVSGEVASSTSTDGAPALSREGEHGAGRGARALERPGSPGVDVALGHGAAGGGTLPARGAAPAAEELGCGRPGAGDDAAGARRDAPAADGAPGAAPASHDRAAPALDFASLRPPPAPPLELSSPELSRPTPATVHLRSTEPGADGAVLKHAAHLRLAAPGVGDVELHLRVLDGVAHLRVDGDAARVVESRAAELSRALAGEGLKLGQLDTRPAPPQSGSAAGDSGSRDSQHQGSGHRREEPSPGSAPNDPAPRRGRASQAAPTSPAPSGGYAVRA